MRFESANTDFVVATIIYGAEKYILQRDMLHKFIVKTAIQTKYKLFFAQS